MQVEVQFEELQLVLKSISVSKPDLISFSVSWLWCDFPLLSARFWSLRFSSQRLISPTTRETRLPYYLIYIWLANHYFTVIRFDILFSLAWNKAIIVAPVVRMEHTAVLTASEKHLVTIAPRREALILSLS